MVFWAWFLGAMLAMLGFLSLVGKQAWVLTPLSGELAIALMVLTVLFWFGFGLLDKPWRGVKFRLFLGLMAFVCAALLFVGRSYQLHTQHHANMLKAPMQVTATVQVVELSDTVYLPAYQLGYRQKAILTNITPLTSQQNTTQQTTNPFYQPNQDIITKRAFTDHTSLTVLLQTPNNHEPDFDVLSKLDVGQQVQMTLSLTPIRPSQTSAYNFDAYRFAMTRHLHAHARIVAIKADTLQEIRLDTLSWARRVSVFFEGWRAYFRQAFLQRWQTLDNEHQQAWAVTLSLLTGDRALIDTPTKALYQYAGISHLLAISGAHVLFLAILATHVMTWLMNRYGLKAYRIMPRWQWRMIVMVLVALLYAMFTGFEVPAVRTVVMLMAVGLARYLLLPWSALKVLGITALVMAWLDVYVLWQAGFWLSFVAVALLLRYESALDHQPKNQTDGLAWRFHALALIKLQTYLFIAMLPLSMLFFGRVSWLGLVVNLFAIGLFGYVIVPLNLLAGLLFVPLPMLAQTIWLFVSWLLFVLAKGLDYAVLLLPEVWLTLPVNGAVLVLGGVVFLLIGTKDGGWYGLIAKRWIGLPLVALTMLMLGTRQPILPIHKALPVEVRLLGVEPALALSQVLVVQDKQAWLILGGELNAHATFDDERFARQLTSVLQAQGVRRLTGVVVQNPDERLAKVAGRLSLAMSVRHFWWAGSGHSRFGKVVSQACVAGTVIQDEKSGFGLRVLTGWQELNERAMHPCAIGVQSVAPSVLTFDFNDQQIHNDKTAFVIDPTTQKNPRLWQLWRLLCQTSNEPTPQHSTVLTLSHGQLSVADLQMLNAQAVYFANVPTLKQQQTAKQRYRLLTQSLMQGK